MRARLLCAIGVSLWSATTAAGQAASPTALPGELRAHVEDERFGIVSSLRGLPLGVRTELLTLFGSPTLDIAEPDEAFQATGTSADSRPPSRRLVAAGCSYTDCLVYYERGGSPRTWRVALFHWTPKRDDIGVGRHRARRPEDHRRRPPRRPVRHDQDLAWALVG